MTPCPVADALHTLGAHHATVDLFRSIERRPANLPSVKVLAAELDYNVNTLSLRVRRAGLPSLAEILRRIRLVAMRRTLEAHPHANERELAALTGWSEAGSLGRHLRDYCRLSFREWRSARTADQELELLLDELVRAPLYAPRWRAFRLFEGRMAA